MGGGDDEGEPEGGDTEVVVEGFVNHKQEKDE